MHCRIFLDRLSLLGRPGRPKVVSIKTFTIFRDRFGLPDRNFCYPSDRDRPGLFGLFRSSASVPVVFPYNRPGRLDAI